jgi:hypothetical protein
VDYGTILNVRVGANADVVHVAANDGVHPDARVLAEADIAYYLRRFIHIAGLRNAWKSAFVRTQHGYENNMTAFDPSA